MKKTKLIALALAASSTVLLFGCSSSSSSSPAPAAGGPAAYTRAADLVAQVATIEIADPTGAGAGPTVTVTTPAADIGTNVTAGFAGGLLTLTMGATNNSTRVLSNLKAVVTALTADATSTVSVSDGTFSGDPFSYFGTNAVDVGAAATGGNLVINNVVGTVDPYIIELTYPTDHAMVHMGNPTCNNDIEMLDSSFVSTTLTDVDISKYNFPYGGCSDVREGVSSPDGKYVYFGHRQRPFVLAYNTVTGETSTIQLSGGTIGHVTAVEGSADGRYLYASLVLGGHAYQSIYTFPEGALLQLVKIDRAAMKEVARIDLAMEGGLTGSAQRIQRVNITPNGALACVPLDFSLGRVAVINLSSMSLVKTLDTSATGQRPRYCAISPDGAYVYVGHVPDWTNGDGGGQVDIYTVADGTSTALTFTTPTTAYPRAMRFDSTGRLFYIRDGNPEVSIFTFTGADYSVPTGETEVPDATSADAFAFGPYGNYYYTSSDGTTTKYRVSDNGVEGTIVAGSTNHTFVISAY